MSTPSLITPFLTLPHFLHFLKSSSFPPPLFHTFLGVGSGFALLFLFIYFQCPRSLLFLNFPGIPKVFLLSTSLYGQIIVIHFLYTSHYLLPPQVNNILAITSHHSSLCLPQFPHSSLSLTFPIPRLPGSPSRLFHVPFHSQTSGVLT